jgi:hypothetical protein
MTNLRSLPFQIAIALLKYYAQKAIGEEAIGIVANELIDATKDRASLISAGKRPVMLCIA